MITTSSYPDELFAANFNAFELNPQAFIAGSRTIVIEQFRADPRKSFYDIARELSLPHQAVTMIIVEYLCGKL